MLCDLTFGIDGESEGICFFGGCIQCLIKVEIFPLFFLFGKAPLVCDILISGLADKLRIFFTEFRFGVFVKNLVTVVDAAPVAGLQVYLLAEFVFTDVILIGDHTIPVEVIFVGSEC